MSVSFSQFGDIHLLQPEELLASKELARLCFGGPEVIIDPKELASYIPPRRGGTYVLTHDDKLISQIIISHDRIRMYDGVIRVASIGGVCTHPDYRNQGHASRLLEYCTMKLAQEGACLMLISGDDGIYIRQGNVPHGRFIYFSIKPGQNTPRRAPPNDLLLRRMTSEDALPISRLYQAEPVHFIRQGFDFSEALHDPSRNTYVYADQWIVERSGHSLAYLFLGCPWELELGAGIRHVGEYAGSRLAMVDALQPLLTKSSLQELTWPVAWQDLELIQLLHDHGYSGSLAPLEGHTLRIVNFPGLMRDLRPNLQARLGTKLLRGLHFEQSGPLVGGSGTDSYAIVRGSARLVLDGAAMTRLVMGNTEGDKEPIQLPGALAEVIPALFPLPSFLPGINYL